MRAVRICSIILVPVLIFCCRPAAAEGWSLSDLNPFPKSTTQTRSAGYSTAHSAGYSTASSYGSRKQPSSLDTIGRSVRQKFDSDVKRLSDGTKEFFAKTNAGTKRFFADTRSALTGKKPSQTRRPLRHPWIRPPEDQRYVRQPQEQKISWFDRLLGREEPKPVETMSEWVGLPRPGR